MGIVFTIKLEPRTKKNSQRVFRNSLGHIMIAPSAAYVQYEKDSRWYMPKLQEPISAPVNIKALFYMKTRRKVDLVNLEEALCDVLVHHGVIADDNSRIVACMDGSRVLYDKQDPRTEVEITLI